MHTDSANIDLDLIKYSIPDACFNVVKTLITSLPHLDSAYDACDLNRSNIHTDTIVCVMLSHRTKVGVKAVAQGLVIDMDQDVVYDVKLALAQ